jgi:hypothetical protein
MYEASTYKLGRADAETKEFPIKQDGEHVGRLEFHVSAGKLHHRAGNAMGAPYEKWHGNPNTETLINTHVAKHEAEARKHFAKKLKEETLSELNYDTVKSLYKKRRDDFHGDEVGKKKKGKEVSAKNVSRSISRLSGFKPTQNQPQKEETEHKVGDSVTVNSKFFGKQKGKVTKIDNQSIHVQRNDKKTSEKYPHDAVVREEVEQIDELKKSTVFSWLKQQPVVPEKKPGMSRKDHNKKIKTSSKSWNRALDRLSGYKPTSENTLDSLAATEAPTDNSDMTNSTPTTGKSYAARMVKSLKKTVKEETYDWEKDDKSSMEKPYGKAPKMNVTDKTGTLGDTKPEARAVMKGGKTLTGQPRDMVEIDPSMKQRPGQQDKGQNTFTSPIAKKSPSL